MNNIIALEGLFSGQAKKIYKTLADYIKTAEAPEDDKVSKINKNKYSITIAQFATFRNIDIIFSNVSDEKFANTIGDGKQYVIKFLKNLDSGFEDLIMKIVQYGTLEEVPLGLLKYPTTIEIIYSNDSIDYIITFFNEYLGTLTMKSEIPSSKKVLPARILVDYKDTATGTESPNILNDNLLEIALESTLKAGERRALPDESFGIPSERKYPLVVPGDEKLTKDHVKKAIEYFHYCKGPYRKELATNIVRVNEELKLGIKIDPKSLVAKYANKK